MRDRHILFAADASSAWTQRTVDLGTYAGQTIYLAFKYMGDITAEWHVDDVAYVGLNATERAPWTIDDVLVPSSPVGSRWPSISSGSLNAREVVVETGAQLNMTGGTLNVYGDWEEQGTGVFNGTGGTITFLGVLDQEVTMNSGSDINNLQIGDGTGSQTVSANSNLDVNGNLSIQSGATLEGGSNTINVGGNWTDDFAGFLPGTGTVVMDGSNQTVDRTSTSATVVNEPFDEADGQACCNSTHLPSGWVREQSAGSGFLAGDNNYCTDGSAIKFNNSTDAWLFSTGVTLQAGVSYQISYSYRTILKL